jgi:ABC-type methionine transport system ATPase subunit
MKNAIETHDLTKVYNNNFTAVNSLNLEIPDKSIFGMLGPNGAGKTTTIKMLTCLIQPTSGRATVGGYDVQKNPDEVRNLLGMVPQQVSLYKDLTVMENSQMCADYYGVPQDERDSRIEDLMELVDIRYAKDKRVGQLSGGQKQRVAIARALATNPSILLCDEATSALDPQTTSAILKLLKEINKQLNITIVIITHQMSVVTEICDKVAIIDNGKVVEQGEVERIFEAPRSDAAKELLAGKGNGFVPVKQLKASNTIRIVFKENSAYEPVLANVILKLGKPINILKADTKNINDKAVGEMILGLPEDEKARGEIIEYLKDAGLSVTEE